MFLDVEQREMTLMLNKKNLPRADKQATVRETESTLEYESDDKSETRQCTRVTGQIRARQKSTIRGTYPTKMLKD